MEVLPYDLLTNKKRPTYARMLKPNDGDIDWELLATSEIIIINILVS